nr:AAA family ATPase [Zobellia sp. B3R18]
MIEYQDYEKKVYQWFMQKHEADTQFTFSVRVKGSKGSELDYFIGTKKSNYFATTFWTLPVAYPGSSSDCINLIFDSNDNKYEYHFEFKQTNSPRDSQNQSVLNLLKILEGTPISTLNIKPSAENNRIFKLESGQRQEVYTSLEIMLNDIDKDLQVIMPAVDKAILKEKENNAEFVAHRITQKEFENMQNKLEVRFMKYKYVKQDEGQSKTVRESFAIWLDKVESSKKAQSYLRAIDILNEILTTDIYTINDITELTELYQDLLEKQREKNGKYYYEKAPSYGRDRFFSAAIKEFIQFTKERNVTARDTQKLMPEIKSPLNSILYGPPGTGKTYKTIEDAIFIANPHFDILQDRNILKQEYKRLVSAGQIVFTTFHQSMSYEDFVEGIKPVLNQENNDIAYEIQDGILKLLSNRAKGIAGEAIVNTSNVDFRNSNFFKMSLGGKNRKDIHDWCITHNKIALGYGGKNNLNTIPSKNWNTYKENFKDAFPELIEKTAYSATATYAFKEVMKEGDIVLVSLGNHIIDAIGVIKADYNYSANEGIPYHHFREVEWLATELNANPNLFVDKNISQQTIYQFNNDDIKIDYLESMSPKRSTKNLNQNYVLIIDEINRGNVSAIFGELITLLEPDKRLGAAEEIRVKLPYSKDESFGVPSNLYIIGTMNTADRSVEALDTALRRRFVFQEVMPKPGLLKDIEFEGFNLKKVLKTINQRIEVLLDRDHTIGHSYFIKLKSGDTEGLLNVFKNNIIPLLQEYFYNDYEKIALVLGPGFVKEKEVKKNIFANFKNIEVPEMDRAYELIRSVDDIEEAVGLLLGITNE